MKVVLITILGAGIGALLGYYGQCQSGTCPLTSSPWRGALFGALIAFLFAIGSTRQRPEPGPTRTEDARPADQAENPTPGPPPADP
jgi:hypothetical protein